MNTHVFTCWCNFLRYSVFWWCFNYFYLHNIACLYDRHTSEFGTAGLKPRLHWASRSAGWGRWQSECSAECPHCLSLFGMLQRLYSLHFTFQGQGYCCSTSINARALLLVHFVGAILESVARDMSLRDGRHCPVALKWEDCEARGMLKKRR